MADEVNIYLTQPKVFITVADPSEEVVTVEGQQIVKVVVGGVVGPPGASGYSGFSGGGGGGSGTSGYSGYSGISGFSGGGGSGAGTSGYSGYSGAGVSGYSGYSGAGVSGYSGYSGPSGFSGPGGGDSGFSGYSGYSGGAGAAGTSGYSGYSGGAGADGTSGYSGYSGAGVSGYSGYSGPSGYSGYSGVSGYSGYSGPSGYSGFTGVSGYSGFTGVSGYSGYTGISGYSGYTGISGYSGYSGISGYSGYSGPSGYSGYTGVSGYSGFTGVSGYSGFSGRSGYSGYTGISGYSGYSGISGYSGYSGYSGPSGYSGYSGPSGYSGYSGVSGYSGYTGVSGYSGYTGVSGYSGYSGISGYSGYSGVSGYSGYSGPSGYSGYSGPSGYSGYSGRSGYSGYSGPSLLPTTEQTANYVLVLGDAETCVAMNVGSANTVTVPLNASVAFSIGTQIVIEQRGVGSTSVVATGGVTIDAATLTLAGQYAVVALVKQDTDRWVLSTGSSGYSGYTGVSGYSGYSGAGVSGYSGYSGPAGGGAIISLTQNYPLSMVGGTIVSKAGTVTGTDGVGSSLFLHRIHIPGTMNVTEVDVAMSIAFPATNQGAGTMSRSFGVFTFGNSTSLGLLASVSRSSAWATGTSTAGGNVSLTQYQGGWSVPLIQPMTFAGPVLDAGEYVVAQLFNFAQASSTWTLNFYGVKAQQTFLASAATNLTSATLGAMSSGGLLAGSALTGLTQIVTGNAANIGWDISRGSSTASSVKISSSVFTVIQQAWVSSVLTAAGSIFSASTSIGAVTNVALGALNSSTLAQLTIPNFGYIGTGSTTSNYPTAFFVGIMSTGGIPGSIELTSAAVTFSGSAAFQQPWFALIGS